MRRLDRPRRESSARTGPSCRVCRLRASVPFLRRLPFGALIPLCLLCGAPIPVCLCDAPVLPAVAPRRPPGSALLSVLAFLAEPAPVRERPLPLERQLHVALAVCRALADRAVGLRPRRVRLDASWRCFLPPAHSSRWDSSQQALHLFRAWSLSGSAPGYCVCPCRGEQILRSRQGSPPAATPSTQQRWRLRRGQVGEQTNDARCCQRPRSSPFTWPWRCPAGRQAPAGYTRAPRPAWRRSQTRHPSRRARRCAARPCVRMRSPSARRHRGSC